MATYQSTLQIAENPSVSHASTQSFTHPFIHPIAEKVAPNRHSSYLVGLQHRLKWLRPGLSVKRWILVNSLGIGLAAIGITLLVTSTPSHLLLLLNFMLQAVTRAIPPSLMGVMLVVLGLVLAFWGQSRTLQSVMGMQVSQQSRLVDRLVTERRLKHGPKIVAIGGGTGLSTLLRGLKDYSANITAIVTVADDGGSSGRLRQDFGMLPPGDIRNCLAALTDEETLLTQLFQYRFQTGQGLEGHSLGNLLLTAMTSMAGDLEQAITASSKLLGIRGRVLPATLSDVHLWAELTDGRRVQGESQITAAGGQIRCIGCIPVAPSALPAALKAIAEADYIVLGPGSLYTSIVPNLLIPDIQAAIRQAAAPCIYVCNIMTQPGETENYSVADHIRAIDQIGGERLFDSVLVHQGDFSDQSLSHYAQEKSYPVVLDQEAVKQLGCHIFQSNVADEDRLRHQIRHHPQRLAHTLSQWYSGKLQPLG